MDVHCWQVTVNKAKVALREDDDPYGRAMSGYRRGLTGAIELETGVRLDGEGRPIVVEEEKEGVVDKGVQKEQEGQQVQHEEPEEDQQEQNDSKLPPPPHSQG